MSIKRTLRPTEEQVRRNIYANIRLGVQQVNFHLPQETPIVLCAGGPSLKDHIEDIRRLQIEGSEVVCVGNSGHLLIANGIKPNGHVIMDGTDRNKSFVVDTRDTRYLVASQCDPSVFKALRDHDHVYIWHAGGPDGVREILDNFYGRAQYWLVPGGSYISLRSISLLHILGYKWMHVFGLDSCLMDEEHHSYAQPDADGQVIENVTVGDRDFRCTYWMLDQADQFIESVQSGRFGDAQLAVHGDGLISYMVSSGNAPTWRL